MLNRQGTSGAADCPAHLSQKIVQQAVAEGRVRKEEED